jgi:hypothetical protein
LYSSISTRRGKALKTGLPYSVAILMRFRQLFHVLSSFDVSLLLFKKTVIDAIYDWQGKGPPKGYVAMGGILISAHAVVRGKATFQQERGKETSSSAKEETCYAAYSISEAFTTVRVKSRTSRISPERTGYVCSLFLWECDAQIEP